MHNIIVFHRLGFQLKQVEQAIKRSSDNEHQLNELLSLRDSLVELIALTSDGQSAKRDPLDDEYALFKVNTLLFSVYYSCFRCIITDQIKRLQAEIETTDKTQDTNNCDVDETSSCEILNETDDVRTTISFIHQ